MTINIPYRRTCRQLADGSYANNGNGRYVVHPMFATKPEAYIRAFLLLQKDLRELFDYVEPADQNCPSFSFRIHELLLRACIEVEANCKAILADNGYRPNGERDLNMRDYRKVEESHRLSGYKVRVPGWHGDRGVRCPFEVWGNRGERLPLPWYQIYNETKHNRATTFHQATFDHLVDAVCGVVVLLSAQFVQEDFESEDYLVAVGRNRDGMDAAIGGFFRVSFADWPEEQRYEFDWQNMQEGADPFAVYPYQPE
ncbi:hypothetical protein [Burkholderia orbicola]|uniref:hypothetical protein n=1 Tax=Burkholderia orbicola TaxID=2978683 RepID=UPI002FE3AA9D